MSTTNDLGGTGFNFDDLVPGQDLDDLLVDDLPQDGDENLDPAKPPTQPAPNEELEASRRANASLAQQLDRQARELEEIRRNQADYARRNAAPPAQTPQDLEALKQKLSSDLLSDPGGTVLRIMEAAKQQAIAEVEARTGPLGAGTASLEVRNFMAEQRASDSEFDSYREDFEALVNQPGMAEGLAKLTPEQRRTTLETLADTAIGRAAKRARANGNANTRTNQVPMYGGGSTVSTSSGAPSGGETLFRGKPLTDDQRAILRAARDAGITDPKRIKAMLGQAGS